MLLSVSQANVPTLSAQSPSPRHSVKNYLGLLNESHPRVFQTIALSYLITF